MPLWVGEEVQEMLPAHRAPLMKRQKSEYPGDTVEKLSLAPPDHFFQRVAALGRQLVRGGHVGLYLPHKTPPLEILHQGIHGVVRNAEFITDLLDPDLAFFSNKRQDPKHTAGPDHQWR